MASITTIAYAIDWRFSPAWPFSTFFLDIVVFIAYVVAIVMSVIWGFMQKSMRLRSFIPLSVNLIPIFIILITPSEDRNKSYHENTIDLNADSNGTCKCHLYLEFFLTRPGLAPGSDNIDAHYLTDSSNFRLYEGISREDDDLTHVTCKGDSVWIGKKASSFGTAEKKVYSIKELKRAHHFE